MRIDRQCAITGLNSAFEQGLKLPSCPADLAPPAGVLDLADIDAFIAAFLAGDSIADIAAPPGVLDLADIDAFIASFLAGCP